VTSAYARKKQPDIVRHDLLHSAITLAAREGVSALALHQVAEAAGVTKGGLLHHFPSKQHLLDALVDHVVADFEWPSPRVDPLERLRRVCYGYRALAHRNPRFFPYVAVHRLNTPTGVGFIERVLTAIEAVVPDHEDAARWFRIVGYYLVGTALDETSGYAAGPTAAEPVDDAYIGEHCPRLHAAAPWFKRAQWDSTFAMGLEALIASMTAGRSGRA